MATNEKYGNQCARPMSPSRGELQTWHKAEPTHSCGKKMDKNVPTASLHMEPAGPFCILGFLQHPFPASPALLSGIRSTNAVTVPVEVGGGGRRTLCACVQAQGALTGLETKVQSEVQGTAELP